MATTFSDNFSTDPSSRWTTLSSAFSWSGSALTSASGEKAQRYNTQLGGLTQYGKITSNVNSGGIVFRASSSGSDGYYMCVPSQGDGKAWITRGNNTGWTHDLASASFTWSTGESFGVILSGTSTSTVARFWRNPTNNTPYDETHWDNSSDTADATVNLNSGSTFEDTGLYIGVSTWNTSTTIDNFYGGDFESDATGNPWYYYAQQMRQKLEEKLKRRIVLPGFADCMRYGFAR